MEIRTPDDLENAIELMRQMRILAQALEAALREATKPVPVIQIEE